jgi:hypothetical protein
MDEWIEEFRSRLLAEKIAPELIALILRRSERIDPRDVELAESLTSCDVTFLSHWEIDELIEASLDDDTATRLAEETRERLTRIAQLLPEVLRLTTKRTDFALRYTIERLSDLVRDFSRPLSGTHPRRDRILNQRLVTLTQTRKAIDGALTALHRIEDNHTFAMEYKHLAAAWHEIDIEDERPELERETPGWVPDFEGLIKLLSLSLTAIDIVTYDLRSDRPREPVRPMGMYKSDVVSLAYDLHRSCGAPPLVTTPGSDFSFLCSLIYEMATGKQNESLAGAIIEFARGRERQDTDDYEREVQEDELAHQTNDNFYLTKRSSHRLRASAAWYTELLRKESFDEAAKTAIARRTLALLEQDQRNWEAIGPFIVWAEQIPRAREAAWRHESEQHLKRERNLRIALGNFRRAHLAKGD